MLHKTRGIVFHTTEFGESSLVARVYTELFGLQSYLVNSVRKKNAKVRPSVFQPLTLVEMDVYHKERGGLQRVAEIRAFPALKDLPYNVLKGTIALFLNEVLYKSIREEEPNPVLFDFLFHTIQILDIQEPANPDFHLLFLIQFSKHLGFYPAENSDPGQKLFNLQEGKFQTDTPPHPYYIDAPMSEKFQRLFKCSPDLSSNLSLNHAERRILIMHLLEYYELHIAGFGEIKSQKVLEQVWGDNIR